MRAPRPRIGLPLGHGARRDPRLGRGRLRNDRQRDHDDQIVQGNFGDIEVKTNFDGHKVDIDTKGDSDLYVVSNVIAPGGHTGWHTHPGPSLITVKSGTITAYEGDDPTCSPTVYTAGQGFVDPGDGHVHMLRNEGAVPAETIAVQLVVDGGTRRIDAPAPPACAF